MRIFWVFSTFILGVLLIALGFIWVQGNMTLPGELHRYLWEKLSWPWISFNGTFGSESFMETSSIVIRAVINESLVCFFFFLSYLLNKNTNWQTFVSPRIVRAAQLSLTGVLFFVLISCWQFTGVIAWSSLVFLKTPLTILSYVLLALAMLQLPSRHFTSTTSATSSTSATPANSTSKLRTWVIALGLEQIYSSSAEAKELNSPLKLQRVSLSLMAGAMLIGTPMSLDRLLFAVPLGLLALRSWAIKTPKNSGEFPATSKSET